MSRPAPDSPWRLLACALLLAGPAWASEEPLPDPELLAFLAEFSDEQGELVEPALLEHLSRETMESQAPDRAPPGADRPGEGQSGRETPPPQARRRAAGKERKDAHR